MQDNATCNGISFYMTGASFIFTFMHLKLDMRIKLKSNYRLLGATYLNVLCIHVYENVLITNESKISDLFLKA